MRFSAFRVAGPRTLWLAAFALCIGATLLVAGYRPIRAQGMDCERLRTLIARGGRGNSARAARRQASELARAQAYAHQLGCDQGFLFFGNGNPQCSGINARISQIQGALSQLQAGGGGSEDLVARYNAYCRGQAPRERGFFESIFGSPEPPRQGPPPDVASEEPDDEGRHGGGGQAVCVRSCDGGFFPLGLSTRRSPDSLREMCTALCPGTEATVFTRSPNSDIKSAVDLDGKSYMDMPNALRFQKEYSSTCSCRPAGKSWAEALANAEEIAGHQHKGDILVTQEKSDEMSRPRLDPKARAALLATPGTAKVSPKDASKLVADPPALRTTEEVVGPDGVKRLMRRVGPQD